MWLRFQYKTISGTECGHLFYCLGPYHMREVLDHCRITFEDMEHIQLEGCRTVSRNELREIFKSKWRAAHEEPQQGKPGQTF